MKRSRSLLLLVLLALCVIAADCGGTESTDEPPDDVSEVDLPSETPTPTNTPVTPTPTVTLVPSATPTHTPSPTPTADPTQAARAACLTEIMTVTLCVNRDLIAITFPDGAPNHQIVNNSDPATLWRDPNTLASFGPGVTLLHNYFTRPENCPLGTACVLHSLMIEFPSQEAALAFFEQVTATGMPGETVVAVPNAQAWDASKCATGTRASSAAGAPPFAVGYCSVSLGTLHWGFNLSAYETLPDGFVTEGISTTLSTTHNYLSAWQTRRTGAAPVEIRWLTGLGAVNAQEASAVQQVVADFNASHPVYQLTVDYVISPTVYNTLDAQIAANDPPDIVGPIPLSFTLGSSHQWLDLAPLIEASGHDLTRFDPALIDRYRTKGGAQIGLPFAVFPSMTYYNRALFDEAGLNYPPQAYGEAYILPDGSAAEWNFDTLAEVAQLLTLDANGNNATEPAFDPSRIVQYGFAPQNQDPRVIGSYFGAASLIAPNGQTVEIPQAWNTAWHWVYDGLYSDHFIPDLGTQASDPFGSGNPFNAGKVAITLAPLGYTCCLSGLGGNWDLAAVPSYNGQTTAVLDGDTFHILTSSPNPEAAFEVLTYLVGDAAPELLPLTGGLPADPALRDAYFDGLDAQFPHGVNWQVAVDSLAFADDPSFAGDLPNYASAMQRLDGFRIRLFGTAGLNLEAEIEALEADLQALADAD